MFSDSAIVDVVIGMIDKDFVSIFGGHGYSIPYRVGPCKVLMDFQAKRRSTVAGEKEPIDALVLLSSHTGMFGDLGPRVVARYIEEVTTHKGDAYVIGENGAKMVRTLLPDFKFKFMDLPNEELTPAAFSEVVTQLQSYRRVKIYYGDFVNIARQEPVERLLSGELTMDMLDKKDRLQREKLLKFLYEPTVSEVGKHLSTKVFAKVFDETIRQAQLGKFASRLMHLDNSLNNLEIRQEKLHKAKRKARKLLDNKKQGLRFAAGMMI